MGTLPPSPPPNRTNNAVAAVLIGIAAVVVVVVGLGLLVARSFLRNTHIVTVDNGTEHHVSIESPMGNLQVNGKGDNAKVDIESPFGTLHVDPTFEPTKIEMAIYPGAVPVTDVHDSPFHRHAEAVDGLDGLDGMDHVHFERGDHTSAEVRMQAGGGELDVHVAEFRTAATEAEVLSYYSRWLGQYGAIQEHDRHGATSLEVKVNDHNVRAASVERGRDGTHFVLVRVNGGAAVK